MPSKIRKGIGVILFVGYLILSIPVFILPYYFLSRLFHRDSWVFLFVLYIMLLIFIVFDIYIIPRILQFFEIGREDKKINK